MVVCATAPLQRRRGALDFTLDAFQALTVCFRETFQGIASREYIFESLKRQLLYVLKPSGEMEAMAHGLTCSRADGLHGAVYGLQNMMTSWVHVLTGSRATGLREFHGPSRAFTGLHGPSRGFTGLHGASRGLTGLHGLILTGSRAHGLTIPSPWDSIGIL